MNGFNDEGDIIAYRRLCEIIRSHPNVWEHFCKEVFKRSIRFRRTYEAFRKFVYAVKVHGAQIAKEEMEYWQQK